MNKRDEIIWTNILRLVEAKGWSLAKLARQAGTTSQTINNIKTGIRGIGNDLLARFAKALDVSEADLLMDKLEIPETTHGPVPIISWVSAGHFEANMDIWPFGVSGEGEPIYSAKKINPYTFALRVEGDSMQPRFMEGDIIIVDPTLACETGDYCIFKLNQDVTFKKLQERDYEIRLVALNDKYPDIVIRKDGNVDFKVIGKVVDMKPKL